MDAAPPNSAASGPFGSWPRWQGASWLGPALAALLGLFAYRALWQMSLVSEAGLESWMFRPSQGQLPPLFPLGIAIWQIWRRRAVLSALGGRRSAALAGGLAAIGCGLFSWALMTRSTDLLMPSLAANVLAFGAAYRGYAGVRALLPAGLVLLLGTPIPAPIQDETVWQLQLASASGAGWLLDALGREFVRVGVILHGPSHTFHVIDACSGLNGILILTLVSLIVRELFADGGWREWLVVGFAPVLGFLLNILRISYIALSPDPEALAGEGGDHSAQGIALLIVGTGILYGLGLALAGIPGRLAEERSPGAKPNPDGAAPWVPAAAFLAVLAILSVLIPGFEAPTQTLSISHFPTEKPGWTSEVGPPSDSKFRGPVVVRAERRYDEGDRQRPGQIVDVLIAYEMRGPENSSRLLSSKLSLPGPDWNLVDQRRERMWLLGRDGDLSVAGRGEGTEHAVIYSWRLRHDGIWKEAWHSLLGLESSPFHREGHRAMVRLVAYAPHGGQLAIDRAKQRLDRFIASFRAELSEL